MENIVMSTLGVGILLYFKSHVINYALRRNIFIFKFTLPLFKKLKVYFCYKIFENVFYLCFFIFDNFNLLVC